MGGYTRPKQGSTAAFTVVHVNKKELRGIEEGCCESTSSSEPSLSPWVATPSRVVLGDFGKLEEVDSASTGIAVIGDDVVALWANGVD